MTNYPARRDLMLLITSLSNNTLLATGDLAEQHLMQLISVSTFHDKLSCTQGFNVTYYFTK